MVEDFNNFRRKWLDSNPITVHAIMNDFANAYTIVNSGCLTYGLVSEKFAKKVSLACIPLPHSKLVISIKGSSASIIEAVKVKIDIDGYVEKA